MLVRYVENGIRSNFMGLDVKSKKEVLKDYLKKVHRLMAMFTM